jgi:hypothetical protein
VTVARRRLKNRNLHCPSRHAADDTLELPGRAIVVLRRISTYALKRCRSPRAARLMCG